MRECIRGLKCRSVEAVHSPAHHACKPQGSALLSREREKHQPLTTALPSLSQIADSLRPSLISVCRALSLILCLFCCYYHSLSFPFRLSLSLFHTFSLSVTVSHTHTYSDAFSFTFSSRLVLFFFSTFYCVFHLSFILPFILDFTFQKLC